MPNSKRLTILNEAEVKDLYGVPGLSLEEKRVSFVLKRFSVILKSNRFNSTYSI
jgi:hypothetical protein